MRALAAVAVGLVGAGCVGVAGADGPPEPVVNRVPFAAAILGAFAGEQGQTQNVATKTPDPKNLFFQPLGTNARSCVTCHQPDHGFTIAGGTVSVGGVANTVNDRHAANPQDAIFLGNDGSDCEDVTTDQTGKPNAAGAYVMLTSLGLIRVALPVPEGADFTVIEAQSALGCAADPSGKLSFYRRPLPTTNLAYLTAVMWDGRESGTTLREALTHQATDAVSGHAQGAQAPTSKQLSEVVDFELSLFTGVSSLDIGAADAHAQSFATFISPDTVLHPDCATPPPNNDPYGLCPGGRRIIAGALDSSAGVNGGPQALLGAAQPQTADANFRMFSAWLSNSTSGATLKDWVADAQPPSGTPPKQLVSLTGNALRSAQKVVAEGERLFNTRLFTAKDVPGLETVVTLDAQHSAQVTCATCHDSPLAKNNLENAYMNTGLSDEARRNENTFGYLPLPLYTLRCADGTLVKTSDVGRAMVTGKCADIGKMKVPVLRGLAARSPYFHNGFSNKERDVIEFYDQRFSIGLTNEEKEALTAFIQAL